MASTLQRALVWPAGSASASPVAASSPSSRKTWTTSSLRASPAGVLDLPRRFGIDSILSLRYAPRHDSILSYRVAHRPLDRTTTRASQERGARPMSGPDRSDTEIRPFRIDVPQAAISTTSGTRLARTRWPDDLARRGLEPGRAARLPAGPGRILGAPPTTGGRTRRRSTRSPSSRPTIDGQTIHFLHVRSPEPDALPLVITHGYPSSIAEFVDLIGPLTDPRAHGGDPADAFHVVAPSLPGFGFSGPLADAGWELGRTARAWVELMHRLGYERYGAHGGDIGAGVDGRPRHPRPRSRRRRARQHGSDRPRPDRRACCPTRPRT